MVSMQNTSVFALALGLGVVVAGAAVSAPAFAAAKDYRFELFGKPQASGGKDVVQIRLLHGPDGKPVSDAVLIKTKADMAPDGMATMTAPVKTLSAGKSGAYRFEIAPGASGKWAIRLAAKAPGEAEIVRGVVTVDLVK